MKDLKIISAFMFALILICFLFPFVTIQFMDTVTVVTGFEIVTGNPDSDSSKIIYAFILALIGLGASFFKSRKSTIIASGAGIFGGILLLWLWVETKIWLLVETKSHTYLFFTYEIGFWSILILFFGVTFVNHYLSVSGS